MTVRGMVRVRIIPVIKAPSWGVPDDSSKTEPTAAIAATQEPPNNTPLFGVTDHTSIILQTGAIGRAIRPHGTLSNWSRDNL
jgi:hypothetical protein